jgi:hypothetical protein
MNLPQLLSVIAFLLVHVQTVHAGSDVLRPPSVPDFSVAARPMTATTLPDVTVLLGSFELKLEQTTIADVRDQVGDAPTQHHGDAGESRYWVCFTIPSNSFGERIWLVSGELGGDNHVINAFLADRVEKAKASSTCPALPPQFRPVRLKVGSIGIGSPISSVTPVFGPLQSAGRWKAAQYLAAENGDLDRLLSVAFHWKNGALDRIAVSQATTD